MSLCFSFSLAVDLVANTYNNTLFSGKLCLLAEIENVIFEMLVDPPTLRNIEKNNTGLLTAPNRVQVVFLMLLTVPETRLCESKTVNSVGAISWGRGEP